MGIGTQTHRCERAKETQPTFGLDGPLRSAALRTANAQVQLRGVLIKGRVGKVRLRAGEGLCLAMDFSSYFMQLLSFGISKAPAMVILNGMGAAVPGGSPGCV